MSRALLESAIRISGSPLRRFVTSTGMSLPVTLRATSKIWKLENPIEEPKLNAVEGLPLRR